MLIVGLTVSSTLSFRLAPTVPSSVPTVVTVSGRICRLNLHSDKHDRSIPRMCYRALLVLPHIYR